MALKYHDTYFSHGSVATTAASGRFDGGSLVTVQI